MKKNDVVRNVIRLLTEEPLEGEYLLALTDEEIDYILNNTTWENGEILLNQKMVRGDVYTVRMISDNVDILTEKIKGLDIQRVLVSREWIDNQFGDKVLEKLMSRINE